MISAGEVDRYIDALLQSDRAVGEAVVRGLVHAGVSAGEIVDDLIGVAQTRIGNLWERNQISVSQEHLATAMSAHLVSLATELAPPPTTLDTRILVASSPGEWHRLAADMVCDLAAAAGADVLAPPSTASAGQLIPVVHDEGPEVIALSCAMPANLARAYSVVSIAREARVPIIVGGRAFTQAPGRAEVFGVALAGSIGELLERLAGMEVWIPRAGADDAARRIGIFEPRLPEICDRIVDAVRTAPATGDPIADALWVVRALSSTVVCADPSILADQLAWQQRRHEVAGAVSGDHIGNAMAVAIRESAPSERDMVEAAVAAFRSGAETAQPQSGDT